MQAVGGQTDVMTVQRRVNFIVLDERACKGWKYPQSRRRRRRRRAGLVERARVRTVCRHSYQAGERRDAARPPFSCSVGLRGVFFQPGVHTHSYRVSTHSCRDPDRSDLLCFLPRPAGKIRHVRFARGDGMKNMTHCVPVSLKICVGSHGNGYKPDASGLHVID